MGVKQFATVMLLVMMLAGCVGVDEGAILDPIDQVEEVLSGDPENMKKDDLPAELTVQAAGSTDQEGISIIPDEIAQGKRLIEVDGGDMSGDREANVIVDIGFGKRIYLAVTNEYRQLEYVFASKLILQDEVNEPVTSDGRYYSDEAAVPGTEHPDLDQGHIIADSIGSCSNSYAIVPQDWYINRHGDQAYMERAIRDALWEGVEVTDFIAKITYPSTDTMVPSHFEYRYKVGGEEVVVSFDNVIPEDMEIVGVIPKVEESEGQRKDAAESVIEIVELDKKAEYVVIQNTGIEDMAIGGWVLVSERGNQSFTFPEGYVLDAGESCKLTAKGSNGSGDFSMSDGNIWSNSESDPAVLYDGDGEEISRYE